VDNAVANAMNPRSLQRQNCKHFNYKKKSLRPIHTLQKIRATLSVDLSAKKRCQKATK
jgi:hypothetical protein